MSFPITIKSLIPGGKGIGLYERRPVFVPLSVPGDQILVRTTRDRKSYLEAIESEVLQPSPYRKLPPCPHFGICGGCDLQQVEESKQLSAKREILVDALERVGKIRYLASWIKMTPSPFWHYRNRIQIKLNRDGGRLVWGFYRAGSREITRLDVCLVSLPPLWHFAQQLMNWLGTRSSIVEGSTSIEILQGDREEFLVDFHLDSSQASWECLARTLREFDLKGFNQPSFYLSSGSDRPILASGPGFVSKTVGDLVYCVGQGSFFQVNELLLNVLRDCATADLTGRTALDLYCGVGFFSLALTKHFNQVLAVELGNDAGRDLQKNLVLNRVSNCQSFSQEAGAFIRKQCGRIGNLDLVLVDPPRAGLTPATVADVAALGAPFVVYVSCDPTTLSRDLGVFAKHRYEIVSIDILDLFPQTHHFETVAKLRRSSA